MAEEGPARRPPGTLEAEGRVVVDPALLFFVRQDGCSALGHQIALQFGAPGHQSEKHAAHRRSGA